MVDFTTSSKVPFSVKYGQKRGETYIFRCKTGEKTKAKILIEKQNRSIEEMKGPFS